MKYLKLIIIFLSIGLLIQIYCYVNLMVSYKYEVDLMETNIKTEENTSDEEKMIKIENLEKRKEKIFNQQKISVFLFWLFLIGLLISLYIYIILNKRLVRVK